MSKHDALEPARTDLAAYGAALWPPFELALHHKLIVEELEKVERGILDRLMLFLPPRFGKSVVTSTVFPSWYLGRNPHKSIIASSYGQELSSDFGRRVRGFVSDPLHRAIFPNSIIVDDSNAVHRFGLTAGGNYYAGGAGGPITGRGADLLLIDDPIKSREDAYSVATRRNLKDWYQHVAYTRLQPGAAVVLIQTRWHEDDLAGWLLREHAKKGWRVVSLPAIAESGDLLGRAEGATLWPEKFSLETLQRIKEAIGSSAWASLYQRRPTRQEGAIFHTGWFKSLPEQPTYHRCILSLDTAFKTTQTADYSVVQTWLENPIGYYLTQCWRGRVEFPQLKNRVLEIAEVWKPNAVLIEDAASGQSLVQSLKNETRLPIIPVRPQGDKTMRASAVSPLIEAGKVFLPEKADWLADFMDEVTAFPASPHDDMVDAMTQFLNWARTSSSSMDIAFMQHAQSVIHCDYLRRRHGSLEGLSRQERNQIEDKPPAGLGSLMKSRRFPFRGAW
jgi:predicted phage terminase large subunit-like protein